MEEQSGIKELSVPIYQAKGWMKLLGVVMMVQGVLSALTVVGIVIAWLPIWLGVLLFQAASSAESAQLTGSKQALLLSLQRLKTYFVINGVLMLVMVGAMAIMLLLAGGSFMALLSQ